MTISTTKQCSECDEVDDDLELCPACEVGCYDKVTDNECCTGCMQCLKCKEWTRWKYLHEEFNAERGMCNKCLGVKNDS